MRVVRSLRSAALLSLLLLSCPAGTSFAANEQQVGVSAAVNPEAKGTLPTGTTKTLSVGENVLFNERIQTAAQGQTQLLFLDQSAMTIGPNSDRSEERRVGKECRSP